MQPLLPEVEDEWARECATQASDDWAREAGEHAEIEALEPVDPGMTMRAVWDEPPPLPQEIEDAFR
eukprot:4322131-Prymnesium_polylepis.1